MSKKAADTATSVAATIAIEQHFPRDERLHDDDLAGSMLPLGSKVFVSLFRFAWLRNWVIRMTEKRFPGVWAIFPVRKRYIDAKVTQAAGRCAGEPGRRFRYTRLPASNVAKSGLRG